jgi:alkylation response protein AidB-like acyl-CoA dehydrogenase
MTTPVSDETRMLRESAAAFCAAEFPVERVRQMADEPGGIAAAAAEALAAQGWHGILVPESLGGLGLGLREMGVVLEELGQALVPGPFWSAATLGVPAIVASPDPSLRSEWLDAVATGARRVTAALQEDAALPAPDRLTTVAEPAGPGRYRLRGAKRLVPDLVGADAVAVLARGAEGPALFLVELSAAGVGAEENRTIDAGSRYGTLRLDGVEVTDRARLGDWSLVSRLLECGNVGIAAQSVAGAQALFDQVIGYARQRIQFGVPIGTFQAVQHPLADLFGDIESARSAYLYGAWAADLQAPDAAQAVALARLLGPGTYRKAATTSLQAHGGIAFTWEYDLHLHLKRALHFQWLLGGASDYEEIIAKRALDL